MPIMLIDGPEKAGKSTFVSKMRQSDECSVLRQWGPVSSIVEYLGPLAEDYAIVQEGGFVIWDRSWASEFVYNKLVRNRPTDGRTLDFLETGPWLKYLVKIMLVSTDDTLKSRRQEHRDPTDHKVDPKEERAAFISYGKQFNWTIIEG